MQFQTNSWPFKSFTKNIFCPVIFHADPFSLVCQGFEIQLLPPMWGRLWSTVFSLKLQNFLPEKSSLKTVWKAICRNDTDLRPLDEITTFTGFAWQQTHLHDSWANSICCKIVWYEWTLTMVCGLRELASLRHNIHWSTFKVMLTLYLHGAYSSL